jgi:hypothetical protein
VEYAKEEIEHEVENTCLLFLKGILNSWEYTSYKETRMCGKEQ